MKELYELNKDVWYYEVRIFWFFWKKIPFGPWQEYWCPKHKRIHKKS